MIRTVALIRTKARLACLHLGLIALIGAAVALPSTAWAGDTNVTKARKSSPSKSSPSKTSRGSARKTTKTTKTTKATKGASTAKPAPDSIEAVQAWLRDHLATSARQGKGSDLATALLAGIFQLAMPAVVQGQYALAGTGQALRAGSLPADNAKAVAADVGQSLRTVGGVLSGFAARPQLKGQVADVFTALAALTIDGVAAADALAVYATERSSTARARAFEAALERYRSSTQALTARLSNR